MCVRGRVELCYQGFGQTCFDLCWYLKQESGASGLLSLCTVCVCVCALCVCVVCVCVCVCVCGVCVWGGENIQNFSLSPTHTPYIHTRKRESAARGRSVELAGRAVI